MRKQFVQNLRERDLQCKCHQHGRASAEYELWFEQRFDNETDCASLVEMNANKTLIDFQFQFGVRTFIKGSSNNYRLEMEQSGDVCLFHDGTQYSVFLDVFTRIMKGTGIDHGCPFTVGSSEYCTRKIYFKQFLSFRALLSSETILLSRWCSLRSSLSEITSWKLSFPTLWIPTSLPSKCITMFERKGIESLKTKVYTLFKVRVD